MADFTKRGVFGLFAGVALAPFMPAELRAPKFQPTLFLGSSGLEYGWSDWRGDFGSIKEALTGTQEFEECAPSVWDNWRAKNSIETWTYDGD